MSGRSERQGIGPRHEYGADGLCGFAATCRERRRQAMADEAMAARGDKGYLQEDRLTVEKRLLRDEEPAPLNRIRAFV